eukprot:800024-Rhodomonas_salina.4
MYILLCVLSTDCTESLLILAPLCTRYPVSGTDLAMVLPGGSGIKLHSDKGLYKGPRPGTIGLDVSYAKSSTDRAYGATRTTADYGRCAGIPLHIALRTQCGMCGTDAACCQIGVMQKREVMQVIMPEER